jgi:hypothetical protein
MRNKFTQGHIRALDHSMNVYKTRGWLIKQYEIQGRIILEKLLKRVASQFPSFDTIQDMIRPFKKLDGFAPNMRTYFAHIEIAEMADFMPFLRLCDSGWLVVPMYKGGMTLIMATTPHLIENIRVFQVMQRGEQA